MRDGKAEATETPVQRPGEDGRRWEASSYRGARLAMLRRNLDRTPAERIELMCDLSQLARELAADGARHRAQQSQG